MRSQIDNSYFPNSKSQRDIKVTVSIGVAVYPDGIASSNQLLERVDQALYLAKKDGRNKIHLLPSAGKETKEKMVQ
jgi:diguanylate cyclase (GGDEF)-like protein